MKCYAVENHPNDSRVKLCHDGIVQSLTSRMGTGGNNTPIALIDMNDQGMGLIYCQASCSANAERTDGSICPTMLCRMGTGGNNVPILLFQKT